MKDLKDRMKAARSFAKLTQVELAEKLKGLVSQQSLSQLETGESKGSVYIVEIAMACNVNPIWLATGQGEIDDAFLYKLAEPVKNGFYAMQKMDPNTQYQAARLLNTLAEPTEGANGTNGDPEK